MDGFEFVSNSRGARHGGGFGIVVNTNLGYQVKRLQVNCRVGPSSLEVVWALVTPPHPINGVSAYICVCVYSPPRSRLNEIMLDHLSYNFSSLTAKYPGAGIILGGDINNLDCGKLCDTFPDLVNLVAAPTRGGRILDVLITNLHTGYDKASVLPPIQPDCVGVGRPSDHSVAVARPNTDKSARTGFQRKETHTRRAVTLSSLAMLGLFLASFDWTGSIGVNGTNEKLSIVNDVLFNAQDAFCPLKKFTVKVGSHHYASAKLVRLSKEKAKEFCKTRYSERFKQLKRDCKAELRQAKQRKIEEAVKAGGSNNSWLGRMEQLLDPGGKSDRNQGVLPEHLDAGLSRQQQADDYAAHISKISRDYVPLARAVLPHRLVYALANDPCCGHPSLEDYEVFQLLSDRKLTGGVEGDLDPRVVRACLVELTHPIASVYRSALNSHEWPNIWKVEKQVVIKKCPNPQTKDNMRNLGLSPFFNKGLCS